MCLLRVIGTSETRLLSKGASFLPFISLHQHHHHLSTGFRFYPVFTLPPHVSRLSLSLLPSSATASISLSSSRRLEVSLFPSRLLPSRSLSLLVSALSFPLKYPPALLPLPEPFPPVERRRSLFSTSSPLPRLLGLRLPLVWGRPPLAPGWISIPSPLGGLGWSCGVGGVIMRNEGTFCLWSIPLWIEPAPVGRYDRLLDATLLLRLSLRCGIGIELWLSLRLLGGLLE